MKRAKILIVEDDEDLSFITKAELEEQGYETECAFSCREAKEIVDGTKIDLILMDMMLPDNSGIEACKSIRREQSIPVIFISCLSDRENIIGALQSGGDDYMVKPVDYGELGARIEANLRRIEFYEKEKEIRTFHQFEMDDSIHKVWHLNVELKEREEIDLSPTEYKLLKLFVTKQDTLLLYNEMYQYVWGCDDFGDIRTVMVHVSNLRKKVDLNHTDMIHTVRGAGYIFSDL